MFHAPRVSGTFGLVAHAAAFHQVNQLFAQVLGVISGALERLRHQQIDSCCSRGAARSLALQVALKDRAADLVNLGVGLQYPICRFQVAVHKSFMDHFQHSFQDLRHRNQIPAVVAQDFRSQALQALGHRPGQVPNAFQIDDELQAGQQFARLGFGDLGDGVVIPSSMLRSARSSSFSQSFTAMKAMLEEFSRKSRRLNAASFATRQACSHQTGHFFGGLELLDGLAFHGFSGQRIMIALEGRTFVSGEY